MSRLIRRGDLVFDVGAHTGQKTEVYLSEGAHVVCVEPQPLCLAALQKRLSPRPRLETVAGGVGARAGTATLSICSTDDVLSTFADNWKRGRFAQFNWDQRIDVPMYTLDALVARFGTPRYCKLDVEGYELDVLQGLTKPIPFLSFEFVSEFPEAARACVHRLQSLGYRRFNVSRADDCRLALPAWSGADEILAWLAHEAEQNAMAWGDIFATPATDPGVTELPPPRLRLLRRLLTRWNIL